MALAAQVATLDEVPEAQRGFYVADGDKFKLDIAGGEDNGALRVELATAKREAAERRMAIKALEEKFSGIDPAKVKEMLAKLDQDGEKALIAAGKIDEVVKLRTERDTEKLRADLQKQLDEARAETKAEKERSGKYSQRVLDDRIRDAAIGVTHEHALRGGDVLRAAREIFTLDENGNAVQLGEDGQIVLGKDGKTPFSPAEWLESMVPVCPHWFPSDSSGGGAGGSRRGGGMSRASIMALPAKERMEAGRKH